MRGQRGRTIVLVALSAILAVVSARSLLDAFGEFPLGVDLYIPLEAARRWLGGGQPYVPEAFLVPSGYNLPFLYPPFVLPAFAALTAAPIQILYPIWLLAGLVVSVTACRRLAFPWPAALLVLLWPPFTEGLLTGNIQLFAFAAFVALFWMPGRRPFAPEPRPLEDSNGGALAVDGLLATFVGVLKVSQTHAWLYLGRVRPRGAVLGAAVAVGALVVTLPLVGIRLWFDWFDQLGRAANPDWIAIGAPLSVFIGQVPARLVTVITLVAVAIVDRRQAGAWIGLLIVFASPTLHGYGLLFALPAMLVVRRELALVALIMLAWNPIAGWIAIALLGWVLAAGSILPSLYERVDPVGAGEAA